MPTTSVGAVVFAALGATISLACAIFRATHAYFFVKRRNDMLNNRTSEAAAAAADSEKRPVVSLQIVSVVTISAYAIFQTGLAIRTRTDDKAILVVSTVFGSVGNIGIAIWFCLRERSLYSPFFKTSKSLLYTLYTLIAIFVCGNMISVYSNISLIYFGESKEPPWLWLIFSVTQLPISILAGFIYVRPFLRPGVSLALSPVLREILARTAVGVMLYVGSWLAFWVWWLFFVPASSACQVKNCLELSIFDLFVFCGRVMCVFVSHRDDVPVRKYFATVRANLSNPHWRAAANDPTLEGVYDNKQKEPESRGSISEGVSRLSTSMTEFASALRDSVGAAAEVAYDLVEEEERLEKEAATMSPSVSELGLSMKVISNRF